jgi:hypothetical protein
MNPFSKLRYVLVIISNNFPYFSVGWIVYSTASRSSEYKTCNVGSKVAINKPGFVFAGETDGTIEGLSINLNKNISFLPEKVFEKFPNLKEYRAFTLGLRVIGKVNFEKLSMLETLDLDYNFITTIQSDTFDDLVALEYLLLGE